MMKVYIDQGVDQKKIKSLKQQFGFELVQHQSLEDDIKIADDMPGVFVLDQSMLNGGDYLADDDVAEYEKVIGKSIKNDRIDTAHLYTAVKYGCDYFVTNNPRSFIYKNKKDKTNTKRESLESISKSIKIVTLDEFEGVLQR